MHTAMEDYEDDDPMENLTNLFPLIPRLLPSMAQGPSARPLGMALGMSIFPFMKIFGNLFRGLPFVLSPLLVAFRAALQNVVLDMNPVLPYVLQLFLYPILTVLPRNLSAHLAVAVPLILFVILPPLLGPLSNFFRAVIKSGTRSIGPWLPMIQVLGRHRLSLVTLLVSLVISLAIGSGNKSYIP